VDTLGLVLEQLVLTADVQDRDGARRLRRLKGTLPRLRVICADGAYAGRLIPWVKEACGWLLQTVLRPVGVKGFVVRPKRWVVERTFAWLGRYRRLAKDYEYLPRNSDTMIHSAMIHLMSRRLLPEPPS
jgi:putative transposase